MLTRARGVGRKVPAFLENTNSCGRFRELTCAASVSILELLSRISMADRVEDQAYLVFVNGHIDELEERIDALKERMATMVLQNYEIQNQQALLSSMLQVREDIGKFRTELIETFNEKYSDP